MKKIFARLSAIHIKLFFWFWLSTIVTIAATRFVSSQLSYEGQISSTHIGDVKKLNHITRTFKKRQHTSIEQLIKRQRIGSRKQLLIQEVASGTVLAMLPKSEHHFNDLKGYLLKNTFTSPTTVKFPHVRLTGPVLLAVKEKEYRLFLVSGEPKPSFNTLIKQFPTWLRILIPLTVSFLLCWLLAKNLAKPIRRMKSAAVRFGEGDLSARVEKSDRRADELGDLARTFNQMAAKLQQNVQSQQRLLGDVSHELRSPLTRLQIAIALAEKSTDNPKALNNHLQRCELEVERLDAMLSDVLALSRLENTIHHVDKQPEDLKQLVVMLVEDSQYLANESNIQIKAELPEQCEISIDNDLIASAIGNVLNNAVKYNPSDSEITLSLVNNQEEVTITITDAGDGVPENALENLFKPFYRTSDARDRQTGGIGLGLAIAHQAIAAHQGKITASNQTSGGLQVEIILPK